MPRTRPFIQCDVFTDTPTRGNALAVVLDGTDLSDEAMFAFAAWTNLAETTFLLPTKDPTADYRLRIFTPTREMPFAGHPTLGSCAAWLHAGGKPKQSGVVRQECKVGLVDIQVDTEIPAFVAPPTKIEPLESAERDEITAKLGIEQRSVLAAATLDNGPIWKVFELATAQDVLNVDSSKVQWPDDKCIGLIGAHPENSECDYEVRMLAPSSGMGEDPITGSLNSALAHWFESRNQLPDSMLVAQGTVIGRLGRVFVSRDLNNKSVLIGGHSHILIEGTVEL